MHNSSSKWPDNYVERELVHQKLGLNENDTPMPSRVRASSTRVMVRSNVCSVRPIPCDVLKSRSVKALIVGATCPASTNSAMSTNGPAVHRYSPLKASRSRSRKRQVE